MHDDPSRSRDAESEEQRRRREEERRRRADRRHRRQEDAEDVAEGVEGAADLVDLASGSAPTPGFGGGGGSSVRGGGGRGGGWCDGGGGSGRGGGGGRSGGGEGCDGCDCNMSLLHLALLPLLGAVARPARTGATARSAGRAGRRAAVAGPRLSSVLLLLSMVLPDAAAGSVAAAIRLYRRRLTRYTPACPGTPSCSAYALAAVTRLGARRGLRAAAHRLRTCGTAALDRVGATHPRSTIATASTSTNWPG
jgi:putative component of membrane protein insertase Oxa1/YidC/SpoIIIJ protein YidD